MTIISPTPEAIRNAADTLRDSGVVAFATETVYGVGCSTFDERAIEKVYTLKGRPLNNPMIAHVLDVSWVNQLTDHWDDRCALLAMNFWPGALTLVLPRREDVPASACGGYDTIGIRCPSHPVAIALLEEFGRPVSAPSANRSGRISPTRAEHADDEFDGRVTVLDGGACGHGIESTVLSLVKTPAVLRPGSISIEELEASLGPVLHGDYQEQVDSPGTSSRHYAPKTLVKLCSRDEIENTADEHCATMVLQATTTIAKQTKKMPPTPAAYAAQLYVSLRELDTIGSSKILIEQPPKTSEWLAVRDRLSRCSS
jgi:L-threonylcarbamoyladenylate synthase